MLSETDLQHLRAAIAVAAQARAHGNHPFGALLVDGAGRVMAEAENTVVTGRDPTGHAEANLVRVAAGRLGPEDLSACTLYSSAEPCPMCAGAIYWAGIGRVVYALSQASLYAVIGAAGDALPLACAEVVAHGRRSLDVLGPALEDEARQGHLGFW